MNIAERSISSAMLVRQLIQDARKADSINTVWQALHIIMIITVVVVAAAASDVCYLSLESFYLFFLYCCFCAWL
jgi:hypothetical protein